MARIRLLSNYCIIFVALIWGISACQPAEHNDSSGNGSVSVDFPHKVEAKYAKGFRISYHKNYKLLEIIKPFQNQVDTLRYSLVPREIAGKVQVENTEEIAIPVRSLIATSTTHIGLTNMLNANQIITGLVGPDYVYNEEVRQRLKEGAITSFPSGELSKEKVLAMQPDLLMISGGRSSQFDNYRVLRDSGINLLVNSEWLETSPLGKAEWVKVMAALLNKEELANRKFEAVARKYNELRAAIDSTSGKPLVITNFPYKGTWYVPGGNSYNATILEDAGAHYPWRESDTTGGLQKDFEVMYKMGLKADIWINPGAADSKEDIVAKDQRFRDFKAFKTGEIYNNNNRMSPSGGNDFWESGVVHPEILLADLAKIFHPQIVPDHTLYYYQKLD